MGLFDKLKKNVQAVQDAFDCAIEEFLEEMHAQYECGLLDEYKLVRGTERNFCAPWGITYIKLVAFVPVQHLDTGLAINEQQIAATYPHKWIVVRLYH